MIRLTPGGLRLAWHQRFGDGFRTAYWRDVVRPRILRTAPIGGLTDERCEVHVLTHRGDWLNLLWVLKSLYVASGVRYRLCVHEDGSLTAREIARIRSHFPDARVVDRPSADRLMGPILSAYPRCRSFRANNPLALKVFDFAQMLEAEKLLLLDSDVLFFARPEALINCIEAPTFTRNALNKDWTCGYTLPVDELASRTGITCPKWINSGLGLLHRGSIRPDWCEEFLATPGVEGHQHRIEQTLIALCSTRFGFQFLPSEYDVHLSMTSETAVCRHYTGPVRSLMYREGIPRLWRTKMLAPPTAGNQQSREA